MPNIKISIDVTKINKSKLYKGEKGTYLNAVLIETPGGKYGDYMIAEDTSKEDREKGIKGAILGNGKNLGGFKKKSQREEYDDSGDDIPF